MSFMLTRMCAYITLVAYLVVGAVAVRVLSPEMATVSFSTSYSQIFSKTELKSHEAESISAPEIAFREISFPQARKIVVVAKRPVIKKQVIKQAPLLAHTVVAKNELPFHEPVTLSKVTIHNDLNANLASLYTEFKFEMIAATEPVEDQVSTALAATADAEPEFFEYEKETPVTAQKKEESSENKITEIITEEVPTTPQTVHNVESVDKAEEVAVDDLIAFDYSKAQTDIKAETIPTVSKMTTQTPVLQGTSVNLSKISKPSKSVSRPNKVTTHKEEKVITDATEKSGFVPEAPTTFSNRMTIQISGTDLRKSQSELGFEVRFQDDQGEAVQDYNSGEVTVDQELSQPKMTRSLTVLKRGFAPTNTDLILEEGVTAIVLPLVEENKFNELLAPYESRGPIGAVLVELEDDVEGASLDVPYSEMLRLDADMKVTTSDDFSYQLFVGVKAGNALLSYKGVRGDITAKIIHVHERELTFETNFFEDVENERVTLLEEDLLGKEKNPLIISSQEVKEFATNKTAKKINNHTYETNFNRTLLGGRKYLELSHQSEPVFVGFKENQTLDVPSENFMRYILSKFEGSQLGNRCLIQVNLSKKAVKVDVGAESVSSSLVTYTQILDADGKFYDSIGAKSRKIIVVGENQGTPEFSQDGKVNFKITYQDGSVQFLGSYCSPNTYLVEQL